MKYGKDELAQRVAIALLYDVIEQRKPQIKALIQKHGVQPMDEPDDLYYQVVQLSNERGGFFDVDIVKESNEAGYFGIDTIAAAGLKLGGAALKKVSEAVKELKSHPKTDPDGAKIKLKDRLKGIFKKPGPDGNPVLVTDDDLAKNPAAEEVAKATDPDKAAADKDKDKDKDKEAKKILGMSVGLFTGLIILLIIIVIVIIMLIKNRNKQLKGKPKEVDKK